MEQTEEPTYQVILASNIVPGYVKNADSSVKAEFLVGYRNIVYDNGNSICWGLVKNGKFCGKSFSYVITKEQTYALQHYKSENEQLEIVGYNYLILQREDNIKIVSKQLPLEAIEKLLKEIGGINRSNLNILKNSFNTYEAYLAVVGQNIQKRLNIQEAKAKTIQPVQQAQLNLLSKRLSGKDLFQVPIFDKQTEKLSDQKTLTLSFAEQS